MVRYRHTNESLPAIVAGLSPREGDRILAVAGSGDQAFALLSEGARVDVVDANREQLYYFGRRIRSLRRGDDSSLYDFEPILPFQKINLDFFRQMGRSDRLRRSLGNLRILRVNNIFDSNINVGNYNGFFFSNVFAWDGGEVQDPLGIMAEFSGRLPEGTRLYANGLYCSNPWRLGLEMDEEKTRAARSLEWGFRPTVFRRV